MYNTIKFSIFLLGIILVGKAPVVNAEQDIAPLAGNMQMQNEEVDTAEIS